MAAVNYLKIFKSINEYPRHVKNKMIKQLQSKQKYQQNNNQEKENTSETKILTQRFVLKNIYGANKMSCHCNIENKVSDYYDSQVMHKTSFFICNTDYAGEKD